jgi:transposase
MAIVAGFDVHRAQITFDALDTETGELSRGRIDSNRAAVRAWSERFPGQEIEVALEACTGWLFVCEELAAAGALPHLAEPAETSARRGKKRRAKTDRADARHLRELLSQGRLPEAWLPPAHVCEWRTRTRLRRTLVEQRTEWLQRIRSTLFQHGVPAGEVPRLSSSRKAVRAAGLDVGVHRSDRRSRVGKLTKQGSPHARWALYEAAQSAARPGSPDHGAYPALKARGLSHTRTSLTIARKLARRCFHSLRELGPAALEPLVD